MKYGHFYHYFELETGPFRSLSALTEEEAAAVMDKLMQDGGVFASKRSPDYMPIRRQLEKQARDMFLAKGGKPILEYPHSMTYGPCEWIRNWFREGRELRVPVDAFDPTVVSFTYGDLFPALRFQDGKPYRGQVYTMEEISRVIELFGWPQEWNASGRFGPERYVEVQVWDETLIKDIQADRPLNFLR